VADNERREKNSQQQTRQNQTVKPEDCGVRMNEKSTLFLRRLPARLNVDQAAEILGFCP